MNPKHTAFQQWVAAQAAASEAESALYSAQLAEAEGLGPPVASDRIRRARQLRSHASSLLHAALGELAVASQAAAPLYVHPHPSLTTAPSQHHGISKPPASNDPDSTARHRE